MGKLIDGQWHDVWYKSVDGRFVRKASSFREHVSADPGARFPAASGRYHLYVSLACPWAHRTLIFRALKGLQDVISVSGVEPLMLSEGWTFSPDYPDHLHGKDALWQVYVAADPHYTGRVTVPALWDREHQTIVSNESSEIIRMFNSAFEAFTDDRTDYYPAALRDPIDAVNDRVYRTVNNGVYKAGFATTQAAYDEAVTALFGTLDWIEARLDGRETLVGDQITEADWRLFTTLVRFDAVYHTHFKCNLRRLSDYPRLSAYVARLVAIDGVRETIDLTYTKAHYFRSHTSINPHGIIPLGPLDLPV